MPILNCYVDDETMKWLERASADTGRKIAELAEAAISEATVQFKVDCMKRSPQETITPENSNG